jgi:trans-aconitate methyltransferase
MQLIDRLAIPVDAAIIDIGGGASTLVDDLESRGFADLTVLDVSDLALVEVRRRLGESKNVRLLRRDLLAWTPDRRFDVWHDRAVFHFLTDPNERQTYGRVLRSALSPNGTVIMATFAPDGPPTCSGLPVVRHSASDLAEFLGADFELVEKVREVHLTPDGATQPFTWVAARHRIDEPGGCVGS